MGIYSAADTAPSAYIGSVIDSAKVRADGRPHSPQTNEIYDRIASTLGDLQFSLSAPVGAVLPPSYPHLLAELPAFTQKMLSQALYFTGGLGKRRGRTTSGGDLAIVKETQRLR